MLPLLSWTGLRELQRRHLRPGASLRPRLQHGCAFLCPCISRQNTTQIGMRLNSYRGRVGVCSREYLSVMWASNGAPTGMSWALTRTKIQKMMLRTWMIWQMAWSPAKIVAMVSCTIPVSCSRMAAQFTTCRMPELHSGQHCLQQVCHLTLGNERWHITECSKPAQAMKTPTWRLQFDVQRHVLKAAKSFSTCRYIRHTALSSSPQRQDALVGAALQGAADRIAA